jgi:lysozyme family protein
MKNEGGYTNDPDDVGGETYKGISRRYNPSWNGWEIIDEMQNIDELDEVNNQTIELDVRVKMFYKSAYFDPYRGDEMPYGLALEMFDTSVNMGVGRTVGFLQTALNVLNRNGTLYQDMVVDGMYGNTTHSCLQTYLKHDTIHLLVKIINVLQGNHYIEYMKKSPIQEKYARGWFSRVNFTKRV